MNYEMIDTKKLDERGRQIVLTLNSNYPIFKTMAKLNVSLFGGVLFDGDNVSLIMYLEKPADMKREDSIFLSKVPHKDLGDFVMIKDSSKEFSELLAIHSESYVVLRKGELERGLKAALSRSSFLLRITMVAP